MKYDSSKKHGQLSKFIPLKFYGEFSGFTVVETIIAVAIAGIIMLVVFIAIPQAQVSLRDNQRKAYARSVVQGSIEFYKNNSRLPECVWPHSNGTQCPNAPSDAAKFITNYMPEGKDPSTGASYPNSTAAPITTSFCKGMGTPSSSTIYCWDDTSANFIKHNFVPKVGQIIIAAAHVCDPGVNNGEVNGTLIDQISGRNNQASLSVIIGLERGDFFCVSNDSFRYN